MKSVTAFVTLLVFIGSNFAVPAADTVPQNPLIDYPGFLSDAATVGKLRNERRISEEEFLRLTAEPGTVVLDARSSEKYRLLHVKGAKKPESS